MRYRAMVTYAVEQLDALQSVLPSPFAGMDLMSPFVIRKDGRYRSLVRGVPKPAGPDIPTGIIISAWSDDGLNFVVDEAPAIAPSDDKNAPDAGGCEDPTIVLTPHGDYLVYYTGVDAAHKQGSLNVARGPDLEHLVKQGKAMEAPPGEGNIKEATLVQTPSGDWRLFFEYAHGVCSRVGIATGPTADGPWTQTGDPFTIRKESWDDFHLSTGPICSIDGHDPVMFYNGATNDARWRIGWISFDPDFTRVTGRGIEPVILPPPPNDRTATDIAFAASAIVEDGEISLYFSIEDRDLRRARIKLYTR